MAVAPEPVEGRAGAAGSGAEGFGQALSRLAVGSGPGRARPLSAGAAVGNQTGDGGPARVVVAGDLPEGNEWVEDPVEPPADGGQGVAHGPLGEDVGEWPATVLNDNHLVFSDELRRPPGGTAPWSRRANLLELSRTTKSARRTRGRCRPRRYQNASFSLADVVLSDQNFGAGVHRVYAPSVPYRSNKVTPARTRMTAAQSEAVDTIHRWVTALRQGIAVTYRNERLPFNPSRRRLVTGVDLAEAPRVDARTWHTGTFVGGP
jgi:hypothetical protein